MRWVTDRPVKDAIRPTLENLYSTIDRNISSDSGILWFEGIELLVRVNGFDAVLKFVRSIVDISQNSEWTILIVGAPGTMDEEQWARLRREAPTIGRQQTTEENIDDSLSFVSEIGIYSTDQLIKLLGVVDEDIRVHLTKAGDKAISLKINDSVSAVNYMLSDVSIINEPPQMKQIPNFELEINVTPSLIDKFISGKSALADEDKFTVITDGENTKLVIGYASVNTNRVTIPVTTNTKSLIDKISFNANLFKEVLSANKECESATLYVSSEGLAKITFKVDDFSSTYFFVAAGDID